jgi:hypothetical protein
VIPGEGRDFVSSPTHPDQLFALPSLLADRYWKPFPWGQSRPSMDLYILCLHGMVLILAQVQLYLVHQYVARTT